MAILYTKLEHGTYDTFQLEDVAYTTIHTYIISQIVRILNVKQLIVLVSYNNISMDVTTRRCHIRASQT